MLWFWGSSNGKSFLLFLVDRCKMNLTEFLITYFRTKIRSETEGCLLWWVVFHTHSLFVNVQSWQIIQSWQTVRVDTSFNWRYLWRQSVPMRTLCSDGRYISSPVIPHHYLFCCSLMLLGNVRRSHINARFSAELCSIHYILHMILETFSEAVFNCSSIHFFLVIPSSQHSRVYCNAMENKVVYAPRILDKFKDDYPKVASILTEDAWRKTIVAQLILEEAITGFAGMVPLAANQPGSDNIKTWFGFSFDLWICCVFVDALPYGLCLTVRIGDNQVRLSPEDSGVADKAQGWWLFGVCHRDIGGWDLSHSL